MRRTTQESTVFRGAHPNRTGRVFRVLCPGIPTHCQNAESLPIQIGRRFPQTCEQPVATARRRMTVFPPPSTRHVRQPVSGEDQPKQPPVFHRSFRNYQQVINTPHLVRFADFCVQNMSWRTICQQSYSPLIVLLLNIFLVFRSASSDCQQSKNGDHLFHVHRHREEPHGHTIRPTGCRKCVIRNRADAWAGHSESSVRTA